MIIFSIDAESSNPFCICELTDQSNSIKKQNFDFEGEKKGFLMDFEENKSRVLKSRFISFYIYSFQIKYGICVLGACACYLKKKLMLLQKLRNSVFS